MAWTAKHLSMPVAPASTSERESDAATLDSLRCEQIRVANKTSSTV